VVAGIHGGARPRSRSSLTRTFVPAAVPLARTVEVGGQPLAVSVTGSGPGVLFLHGSGPGTTASGAWRSTCAALAERFQLVTPDQAGFGRTPLPAGRRAGRALWTEQAVALMDLLGHSRYALVGHSMGGAVALSIAAARPDAVRCVVGIGCMGAEMALPAGLDRLWAARPTRDDAEHVLRLIAGDPDAPVAEEAVAARLDAMCAHDGYAGLFPPPRDRWVADLALTAAERAAVRQPVLLIHGARDRIVPLRDGAVPLVEQLPLADLHVLGNCGHSPHVERPEIVNRLTIDFLETHA
jgi:2-hydroxymuconate-semialdehyde hydrolase